MEQPLQLIQSTEDGFQLNPEVVEFFSECEKPIVVVSVAGRYREGKSFLANWLLGEQKGFALGSTLESKTKGLWVWCKPHPTLKDHLLIVLDTEGLEDPKKGDPTQDLHIFTLAVLISSYFILNSTGKIDNSSIQILQLATEMVERVRVKADEEANAEDLSQHLPAFCWVLRDFFLETSIDGGDVTPDEYLEDCLKPEQGTSRRVLEYNLPREVIRNAFVSRMCWCLPRPIEEEEKLQRLEEQPLDQMKPEFVQGIRALREEVLRRAGPFVQSGGRRNASQWIKICESYVSAINRGACPVIRDAFMFMVDEQNKEAHEQAVEFYSASMSESLAHSPHESEDLRDLHMNFQKEAFTRFTTKAWCSTDENFNCKLLRELQEAIDEQFKLFDQQNAGFSERFCEALMNEVYQPIIDKIGKGEYTVSGGYQQYEVDRAKVREFYVQRALGPEKERVFHKLFYEGKRAEVSVILQADKALSEREQNSAAQRQKEETDRSWKEMEDVSRRRALEAEEALERFRREVMENGKQKMQESSDAVENLLGLAGSMAAVYLGGPTMAPVGQAVGRSIGMLGKQAYVKIKEAQAAETSTPP